MSANGLPRWWEPLLSRVRAARTEDFTRLPTPEHGGRESAVLVLLGERGRSPGDPPGLSGNSPGPPGDLPGRSGAVSGLSGAVSGLSGAVSGLSGDSPGPSGDLSGRSGAVSGAAMGGPDPARDGRRSADPDVLLLQRAATLRTHAGQPAFPGGAAEPGDSGPADTALREAEEEVGLDPASVTVLAQLPRLWIPVSGFVVTPVLAWWHRPHDVHPRQPEEVAHVARLPVSELVDPGNRLRVRHPSGWIGPAFQVRGMVVWGFTAGVLSALLDMAGWAVPWPRDRVRDLPPATMVPGPAVGDVSVRRSPGVHAGQAADQRGHGPSGTTSTVR